MKICDDDALARDDSEASREPMQWDLNCGDAASIASARCVLFTLRAIRMASPDSYVREKSLMAFIQPLAAGSRATIAKLVRKVGPKSLRELLAECEKSGEPIERSSRFLLNFVSSALRVGSAYDPLLRRWEQKLEVALQGKSLASDRNVQTLGDLLGIGPIGKKLFQAAVAWVESPLDDDFLCAVKGSRGRTTSALAKCLGVDRHALQRLIESREFRDAGLFRSLTEKKSVPDLQDMMELSLLGERLLLGEFDSAADMARVVLLPVGDGPGDDTLRWPHLETQSRVVEALLRRVLASPESGINILLYGPPGTGKTAFAHTLLRRLGAPAYLVSDQDESGAEATRAGRLASFNLSQRFAGHLESAVLLLDEAEDVFQSVYRDGKESVSRKSESKSWINRHLESNRHPVIWISNRVDHLDPAYLRRFTFALEFPSTPLKIRREIAERHLAPLDVSAPVVRWAASHHVLQPAHLASVGRLVRMAAGGDLAPDVVARQAIESQLNVLGDGMRTSVPKAAIPFRPAYLNLAGDLSPERFLERLSQTTVAALLFSGPPGTGKTQLASQIAMITGRELTYRTASDINTMWFGESERNVAKLFKQCDPASEVLFIDEAETLFACRLSDSIRAQVAVTAEFLRQIEAFEGIVICATNHRGALDAALMRRFNVRLEFQPLSTRQRRELFAEMALGDAKAVDRLSDAVLARLDRMDQLTPGDYANVLRRIRLLALTGDVSCWWKELEAEVAVKPGASSRAIGFA